jgi:hypothetical protein
VAVLTGNLNARLGTLNNGQLLATLRAGTRVRVIQAGGPRAVIEVSVLRDYLRPV